MIRLLCMKDLSRYYEENGLPYGKSLPNYKI